MGNTCTPLRQLITLLWNFKIGTGLQHTLYINCKNEFLSKNVKFLGNYLKKHPCGLKNFSLLTGELQEMLNLSSLFFRILKNESTHLQISYSILKSSTQHIWQNISVIWENSRFILEDFKYFLAIFLYFGEGFQAESGYFLFLMNIINGKFLQLTSF